MSCNKLVDIGHSTNQSAECSWINAQGVGSGTRVEILHMTRHPIAKDKLINQVHAMCVHNAWSDTKAFLTYIRCAHNEGLLLWPGHFPRVRWMHQSTS